MSPAEQKKRFRVFAKQLENGIPPTQEQTEYLIHIFREIGKGQDPERILGLKYGDGKSRQDETSRSYMDFLMHWIACATEPDIDQNGKPIRPYSMKKAFEEASRIARKLSNPSNPDSYDPKYISRVWYERKKQGKVGLIRSPSDPDSIYEYTPPDTKN